MFRVVLVITSIMSEKQQGSKSIQNSNNNKNLPRKEFLNEGESP